MGWNQPGGEAPRRRWETPVRVPLPERHAGSSASPGANPLRARAVVCGGATGRSPLQCERDVFLEENAKGPTGVAAARSWVRACRWRASRRSDSTSPDHHYSSKAYAPAVLEEERGADGAVIQIDLDIDGQNREARRQPHLVPPPHVLCGEDLCHGRGAHGSHQAGQAKHMIAVQVRDEDA